MSLTDEQIRQALEVKCGMCKQPPGEECVSIITDKPLPRRVHYYRLETGK